MNSPAPPPGWHPDPANPASSMRWWDGTQWTEQTQPVYPSGAPTGAAPYGPSQWGGTGAGGPSQWGGTGAGGADWGSNGWSDGYGGPPPGPHGPFPGNGVPGGGNGPYRGSYGGPFPSGSFAQRSQSSLVAIGFSILYIVIALAAHVVFFGIVPVLAAFRAFKRREPLAPLAAVAAGLSVVIAVASMAAR